MHYLEDIFRREHHIKRTLGGFAFAVVVAAMIWLAFLKYV
jgi:hypothetical protein